MIFLELSHHHPQFILIFSSCEQLLCFLCALHSGRTACIAAKLNIADINRAFSFTLLPFVAVCANHPHAKNRNEQMGLILPIYQHQHPPSGPTPKFQKEHYDFS